MYLALVAIRDAFDRPVEVALVSSVTEDFLSSPTVPERQELGPNVAVLDEDILVDHVGISSMRESSWLQPPDQEGRLRSP